MINPPPTAEASEGMPPNITASNSKAHGNPKNCRGVSRDASFR